MAAGGSPEDSHLKARFELGLVETGRAENRWIDPGGSAPTIKADGRTGTGAFDAKAAPLNRCSRSRRAESFARNGRICLRPRIAVRSAGHVKQIGLQLSHANAWVVLVKRGLGFGMGSWPDDATGTVAFEGGGCSSSAGTSRSMRAGSFAGNGRGRSSAPGV